MKKSDEAITAWLKDMAAISAQDGHEADAKMFRKIRNRFKKLADENATLADDLVESERKWQEGDY